MKKFTIFTFFILAFVLLFSSTVSADTIPPDSHQLDLGVKFVNLNEFPDIEMIARLSYMKKGDPTIYNTTYVIDNNQRLTGSLDIYWQDRRIKDQPPSLDSEHLVAINRPGGGYISNSNPLVKETIEYTIVGFSGNKLMAYKSRQISEYWIGSPEKVENFDNPWLGLELSPTPPSPEPAKLVLEPVTPPNSGIAGPNPVLPSEPAQGFWQTMPYEQQFLFALLLTLIIEIPVAILLVKALHKLREISISKIILIGFIASALTFPYLWFILPMYIHNRVLYILLGEASVIFVEVIIYNRFLKLRLLDASVVSLVANIASVLVGLVLM